MQRYDWSFLEDLGYAREDILRLGESWPEGLREMLADTSFRHEYTVNIQTLRSYVDSELALELAANYPGTMALKPEYFQKRLAQLRKRVRNWDELIEAQLRSGAADAIFEHIGDSQSRWAAALDRLESPHKMEWSLVSVVREASGVELDVHWMLREHGLEYLLSLEAARYEIAENARFLVQQGVGGIDELILHHAWPFQYPMEEFEAKYYDLLAKYGDDLPVLLETDAKLFEQMY